MVLKRTAGLQPLLVVGGQLRICRFQLFSGVQHKATYGACERLGVRGDRWPLVMFSAIDPSVALLDYADAFL